MILASVVTVKTTIQTDREARLAILRGRGRYIPNSPARLPRRACRSNDRASVLSGTPYGAPGPAAATCVGYYPWFGTFNFLSDHIPKLDHISAQLLAMPFSTSAPPSSSMSSPTRYAASRPPDPQAPGLKTRILASGLQGIMFSVFWKLFPKVCVAPAPPLISILDLCATAAGMTTRRSRWSGNYRFLSWVLDGIQISIVCARGHMLCDTFVTDP